MRIILSETLSYCFGVRKTLDLAEKLLRENPGQQYFMLGEIVHNEYVIEDLMAKGLRFVRRLEDVPPDSVIILQSHGSPLTRYVEIQRRGLEFIDATCPMVRLIHKKIREVVRMGLFPIVIGHEGHEEVQGIVGQVERAMVIGSPREVTAELFKGVLRAGVVVQSTFITEDARRILEEIQKVVPEVVFHDTICQPTKLRQKEVETHSLTADHVIVVGSKGSANTMHLYRIAAKNNACTHLIDSSEAVDDIEIPDGATVFIASGASTPEELVFDVVQRLKTRRHQPRSGGGLIKNRRRPGAR